MAQGRMIRKSIATDSKVKQMDDYCKLFYTWSMLFADRDGRINADPAYLEYTVAQNLDKDNYDTGWVISEWARVGLCTIYEDNNGQYIQFNNFRRLQGMENDSGMTALYKRERASVFPEPASCKIIAGQSHCNLHTVVEQSVLDAVEKNDDFTDQVKVRGHTPEAYEPMNATKVIKEIFSFIRTHHDIMVPVGSLDLGDCWDNLSSKDRGIAKRIGAIATPVRLPLILEYIRKASGFIYGPVSPLVLKLVKEWNDTELKALERL